MFIEHDGKLAFTFGWFIDQNRPVRLRHVSVSKAKADNWLYLLEPPVLDRQISWAGNIGLVHLGSYHKPVKFDTTDWKRVTEEQPIKKPRRGKRQGQRYDWEWAHGEWRRVWL